MHIKEIIEFEGVLRITFRHTREDETGTWRKLHNEQLHNVYS
jgi:hypothetical protein